MSEIIDFYTRIKYKKDNTIKWMIWISMMLY